MSGLTYLYLNKNHFVEFPPEITDLTSLVRLDMSFNKLTAIPARIDNLRNLKCLYVESNMLKTIPTTIEALAPELVELRLDNNLLEFLPVELAGLTELKVLSLEFNELATIPRSVVKEVVSPLGSIKKMMKYLQDLQECSESFKRLRLMFVGDGGVGKTTLLSCFEKERKLEESDEDKKDKYGKVFKREPKKLNIATDGIDIADTKWQGYVCYLSCLSWN